MASQDTEDAAADVNSTVFLAKSPYNNAEREMPQAYYATDLCSAEPVDGACFESTLRCERRRALLHGHGRPRVVSGNVRLRLTARRFLRLVPS